MGFWVFPMATKMTWHLVFKTNLFLIILIILKHLKLQSTGNVYQVTVGRHHTNQEVKTPYQFTVVAMIYYKGMVDI